MSKRYETPPQSSKSGIPLSARRFVTPPQGSKSGIPLCAKRFVTPPTPPQSLRSAIPTPPQSLRSAIPTPPQGSKADIPEASKRFVTPPRILKSAIPTPPQGSKTAIPETARRFITPPQSSKSAAPETAKRLVTTPLSTKSGVPAMTKRLVTPPQSAKNDTPQSRSKCLPASSKNPFYRNPLKRLQEAAKAEIRQKNEQDKKLLKPSTTPWTQKHQPETPDELFVNKMKIKEVETWLLKAINPLPAENANNTKTFVPKPPSKICLLSGPSGSGKTATIMVLAKYLNIDVKEWRSQCDLVQYDPNSVFGDEVSWRNQTDIFVNFFSRSAQYSTLPIKGKNVSKTIVVVEELPVAFYKDTKSFHNVVTNLCASVTNPIIFIVGDGSSHGYNNLNALFPKNLLETLNIHHITFNPVAEKFLLTFMNWVCKQENVAPSKTMLDEIAKVSGGDVGIAINGLQYSLTTQKKKGKSEQKSVFKKPFSKGSETGALFKDENLFLFHALGKVFYAKRNTNERSVDERLLVPRLKDEIRVHPMAFVPEDLLNKIEVSSELFLNFLQQNYLLFFSSLYDSAKAMSYIADSEQILCTWIFDGSGSEKGYKSREKKEEIATSVAIRSIIHYNTKPSSNSFKPYRKPLCNDLHTRMQQTVDDYQSLIPAQPECMQSHYYTDVAPYYLKIRKFPLRDRFRAMRHVFEDKNKFGCHTAFKEDTKLDDIFDTTMDQDVPILNQCKPLATDHHYVDLYENPEEFNIEEYDSD